MNNTQDALRVALEAIEQFQKDLYAVPNFADRVNKATRDALHQAHMNILALPARIDAALSAAPASEQQPMTDEQIIDMARRTATVIDSSGVYLINSDLTKFARALLAQQAADSSADRKDAERYRWLRDTATDLALVIDKRTKWVPPDDAVPGVGGYWMYEYRAGDELDSAIDAAIAAQSQPQEGDKS